MLRYLMRTGLRLNEFLSNREGYCILMETMARMTGYAKLKYGVYASLFTKSKVLTGTVYLPSERSAK
jgi:hypothetical protein